MGTVTNLAEYKAKKNKQEEKKTEPKSSWLESYLDSCRKKNDDVKKKIEQDRARQNEETLRRYKIK